MCLSVNDSDDKTKAFGWRHFDSECSLLLQFKTLLLEDNRGNNSACVFGCGPSVPSSSRTSRREDQGFFVCLPPPCRNGPSHLPARWSAESTDQTANIWCKRFACSHAFQDHSTRSRLHILLFFFLLYWKSTCTFYPLIVPLKLIAPELCGDAQNFRPGQQTLQMRTGI